MNEVETPKMSCKELVDVITEYLEGTLPTEDRGRFERHLAGCDGCQAYLDQMRETIRALGHLPPESLSAEAQGTLLEAFRGWRDAASWAE
jgi:anti-sigma factor RsiW